MKKEVASLDELKEKLMREYTEQKFNLNSEVEKKLHNKLSIIFNYQFKSEDQNHIHRVLLYNFLSSKMIKDYILDIIHHANKYLSEKYEIDDLKFEELNNKTLTDDFQKKISKIRNGIDEQLIKWISYELIEQAEFMDSTIFVNQIDKFIRAEKITNNSKERLKKLDLGAEDFYYAIHLFEIFNDFKDKLQKNNIIGENNKIKLLILNSRKNGNDNWETGTENKNYFR